MTATASKPNSAPSTASAESSHCANSAETSATGLGSRECGMGISPRRETTISGAVRSARSSVRTRIDGRESVPPSNKTGSFAATWLSTSAAHGSATNRCRGTNPSPRERIIRWPGARTVTDHTSASIARPPAVWIFQSEPDPRNEFALLHRESLPRSIDRWRIGPGPARSAGHIARNFFSAKNPRPLQPDRLPGRSREKSPDGPATRSSFRRAHSKMPRIIRAISLPLHDRRLADR